MADLLEPAHREAIGAGLRRYHALRRKHGRAGALAILTLERERANRALRENAAHRRAAKDKGRICTPKA